MKDTLQRLRTQLPAIKYVEVEPSGYCSYNCSYCIYKSIQDDNLMSLQTFKSIAKQLQGLQVDTLVFSGRGDPLENTHIVEMCKYAQSLDFNVTVETILPSTATKSLCKYISNLTINIPTTNEHLYFKITGREFNKARFTESVHNALYHRTNVFIVYTVTYDTLNRYKIELEDIHSMIKGFHTHRVKLIVKLDAKMNTIPTMVKNHKRHVLDTEQSKAMLYGLIPNCYCAGLFYLFITADCKVVACREHIKKALFVLGDLKKSSIVSILTSDRYAEFVDYMRTSFNTRVMKCNANCRFLRLNRYLETINKKFKSLMSWDYYEYSKFGYGGE